MAYTSFYTSWYSYVGGSYRLHLQIETPPSSFLSTDDEWTGTAKLSLETTGVYNDGSNTNGLSGDLGSSFGSTSVAIPAGGGSVEVQTVTGVVDTVVNATKKVTVTGSISGYNGLTNRSITAFVTLPARPYDKPAAPTGVTVILDPNTAAWTAVKVGPWTRNPTAEAPYTTQNVQRSMDSGPWVTIASISGASTTYLDETTTEGHAYSYRVQAVNSGGTTSSAASALIYSNPAPPITVEASRNAGGAIVISWYNVNRHDQTQSEVQVSLDGGAYTALAGAQNIAGSGLKTFTDGTSYAAATVQYRVRTKNVSGLALFSAYTLSPLIHTPAPPNPPTIISPDSLSPVAVGVASMFLWQHNSVDTSPQTAYELEYRPFGGGAWTTTGKVDSGASGRALTFATPGNYEWRVKTWGTFVSPSAVSEYATFTVTQKPLASITSPVDGATVATSHAVVVWTYSDPEGTAQSGWEVQLTDGTTVLESASGSGTATTYAFTTTLLDGNSYVMRVRVRDGAGMWSNWVESHITADYLPPAWVNATATWDEEHGWVALSFVADPPSPGVTDAAETVDVARSINGGPFVTIAEGIDILETVIDTAPSVNGVNCYRLTVYTAEGAASVQEGFPHETNWPTASVPEGYIHPDDVALAATNCNTTYVPTYHTTPNGDGSYTLWRDCFLPVVTSEFNNAYLSTGPAFSELLVIMCDITLAATVGRQKETHHFAGRSWPVEYTSDYFDRALNVGGAVADGFEPVEDFALTPDVVLWRDPTGRRMFASISPVTDTALGLAAPKAWQVTFALTEVEYAE